MMPAFSGRCDEHTGVGNPDRIDYNLVITNQGNHFDGAVFTTPAAGYYYFSIEFVKDAYSHHGTADDVYVVLHHWVGDETHKRPVYAWSGEGAGQRGTGAASVALQLPQGAHVATYSEGDGGSNSPTRFLPLVIFSGFRIH
jgi:C1q domain-containing protein